jgi:hypothetical protein
VLTAPTPLGEWRSGTCGSRAVRWKYGVGMGSITVRFDECTALANGGLWIYMDAAAGCGWRAGTDSRWYPAAQCAICVHAARRSGRPLENKQHVCARPRFGVASCGGACWVGGARERSLEGHLTSDASVGGVGGRGVRPMRSGTRRRGDGGRGS